MFLSLLADLVKILVRTSPLMFGSVERPSS
jgi:hypothetical protein